MSRLALAVVIGLLVVAALTVAFGGPLDPPAGPVTSTYKTLSEVEPRIPIGPTTTPGDDDSIFRISQPGSYYLTGNVTGVAGKMGIEVSASGVTIDLNGFQLTGVPGSSHGIGVGASSLTAIGVRNGTVRDWGGSGVSLAPLGSSNVTIADVRVLLNGIHGIAVPGASSVVRCIARGNTLAGITAGVNASVIECTSTNNAERGIVVGSVSVLQACIAATNGISGITAGPSATITSCTADGNGSGSSGVNEGIFAGDGSTIIGCTAQDNTSTLSGGVGDRGMGFRVGNRCNIIDCTASRNRGHGFRLSSNCRISGCLSIENGSGSTASAGIYVAGENNHIEDNDVNGCDFGIQVITAGNIIMRNTARENGTAYSFVANNIYGPIIDRRIPTPVPSTPAVNGSAATTTLGTTDANANFSY